MKKLLSVCIILLLFSGFGFGQTKEIDSLKVILKTTEIHDTVRIKTNFALAGRFGGFSLDSLKKYTFEAEKLSKLNDNYLLDAVCYYLALYYDNTGDLKKAKEYYQKALTLTDSIKDAKKFAKILSGYATVLNETTELEEKISYNLRALKFRESIDDKFDIGKSQFNLAVIYSNTGFDSLSVKYLRQALNNGEVSGEKVFTGYVLNSLIMYALKDGDLELAEEYLFKSEQICEETGSNMVCYNTYIRKGEYHDKLKEFYKAEQAFLESLKYAVQRGIQADIMFVYAYLGKHYVLAREPQKAIKSFKKFEEQKTNTLEGKISELAYDNWSKAERMIGNYDKSDEYFTRYKDIRDSLDSDKNKVMLFNAETKYQSEKKDKEIAEQKLALTESKSKTRTMTLLIVSLLFGSILLWFSFNQRQKRMQQQLVSIEREQEVKTLESLMEGEEKERLRIAKELHDGVNGDLSAIKFKLSSLLEMNNTVIKEAVTMIDNSCEQVRAISHNLVPPSLKDFNLLEAVEEYCQSMDSIHKAEVSFQHVGEQINLDKKQEANLFRIIQELVTNSIKHAQGNEINVQLSHLKNTLQLTVEDNGKGFDPKTVKSDGIGMQNVQSRVDYLNATIDFVSNEKGTSYTITMDTKTK
ncbi:tetratricopeptide repeat-containing sensor histidine kinase [Zobellia uliginosa]|uniref:tetratricopeptide repeat-containing sensor histidine kinase n=1 Tax=Zobellia uliginosa TaxID=143224 RepID=UPI001C075002|nr:ATP-binding protein [Zobellia uliginosa]MBU2948590.1 tetratricopeptide repeat protein [Zobellia uliginosa]